MIKKINQLNKALLALWVSILLFGVVCQIVGVLFVKNPVSYSLGLWIGIIVALAMAYHMAYALNSALDLGERAAQIFVTKHNMIRYAVVVSVLGILMISEMANPLAAFLGIMGLKVGAYFQPLTDKLISRLGKSRIAKK